MGIRVGVPTFEVLCRLGVEFSQDWRSLVGNLRSGSMRMEGTQFDGLCCELVLLDAVFSSSLSVRSYPSSLQRWYEKGLRVCSVFTEQVGLEEQGWRDTVLEIGPSAPCRDHPFSPFSPLGWKDLWDQMSAACRARASLREEGGGGIQYADFSAT